MNRAITTALAIVVSYLCSQQAAANVAITSNNFTAFATAVQSAAPGTTFSFNLGANSTITFTHFITVPNNIAFVGNGAVTFDGGGTSSLFFIPATSNVNFSGLTFQNSPGDGNSGAINSQGHLTVTGCSFLGNQAINVGGAIYSEGQGTVI